MLLLLGVTLAASAALCMLTWRLAVLDRSFQRQRSLERLQQAADAGSTALLQQIAKTGDGLRVVLESGEAAREQAARDVAGASAESTVVIADGNALKLVPERTLRYLPDPPPFTPAADEAFASGESLEYSGRDFDAASRWFSDLAAHSQGPIRAGALLRAARNDIKRNQPALAVAAYDELARLGSVSVDGEPAELIARFARLGALTAAARGAEAFALASDLEAGRWQVSRTTYEYYRAGLERFVQLQRITPVWEEAVESLLAMSRDPGMESGERVVWVRDSQPVLLIWRSRPGLLAGLALTGKHVADTWLAQIPGFTLGLETADRRGLVPVNRTGPTAERILSFAGAHWRLIAAASGRTAEPDGPATLLLLSLSLVTVLVVTGSLAVIKAVSRELSVARLQTDFVSAVSHEFRTPLTTLRSMSEMLERGRVPSEERKQRYYELMARETARLHHLVEDLLDFGRMAAGVREYKLQPNNIADIVRQTVAAFQEEHAASGVTVEISDIRSAPVLADAEALRRALHNLLDNAVKYSPGAGIIRVEVSVIRRDVLITVEDHGMGIPPNDLKRIFRKFERGTAAKSSSIRGTGLGLTMVASIMKAHGGGVRVDSEVNRGSRFTLVLPCVPSGEHGYAWHES
jgi:signal transduction histidine kinase